MLIRSTLATPKWLMAIKVVDEVQGSCGWHGEVRNAKIIIIIVDKFVDNTIGHIGNRQIDDEETELGLKVVGGLVQTGFGGFSEGGGQ